MAQDKQNNNRASLQDQKRRIRVMALLPKERETASKRYIVYATPRGYLSACAPGDRRKQADLKSRGFRILAKVNQPPTTASVNAAYLALIRLYGL